MTSIGLNRRRVVRAVAVMLMLGTVVVAPSTSASALTGSAITIKSNTTTVSYSKGITISGVVTRLGTTTPLPNRTVVVQRRVPGTTTWANSTGVKTDANGRYVQKFTMTRNMEFRAVVQASATYAGAATKPLRINVVSLVVLNSTPKAGGTMTLGTKVIWTGTVAPYNAAARVTAQVFFAGAWTNIQSKAVNPDGTYSLSFTPTTPGPKSYRLYVSAGTTSLTNRVMPFAVTVYRWKNLSDMEPVFTNNYFKGAFPVNGTTYQSSVRTYHLTGDPGYATYNIDRVCSQLRATIGLDDTLADPAEFTAMVVKADELEVYRAQIAVATSTAIQVPLYGALRVTIGTDAPKSNTGGVPAVWGNVQVYCPN